MRILLLEDEPPSARRLVGLLAKLRPAATVDGPYDTVRDAAAALRSAETADAPAIDLLLCDIQLADGLSLRLWDLAPVRAPVIFVTAYDEYAVRAFRLNSLDYLLKPIKEDELAAALARYDAVAKTAPPSALPPELLSALLSAGEAREPFYRQRVLTSGARGGIIPLPVASIAHFYSEDRVTFAVERAGARPHLISEPLSRLAEELDPREWFLINRGQLVHVGAIARADPYLNHRLKLTLTPKAPDEGDPTKARGVVARDRVRDFKAWLGDGGQR